MVISADRWRALEIEKILETVCLPEMYAPKLNRPDKMPLSQYVRSLDRPFLLLGTQPILQVLAAHASIIFGVYYLFFTTIVSVFRDGYHSAAFTWRFNKGDEDEKDDSTMPSGQLRILIHRTQQFIATPGRSSNRSILTTYNLMESSIVSCQSIPTFQSEALPVDENFQGADWTCLSARALH